MYKTDFKNRLMFLSLNRIIVFQYRNSEIQICLKVSLCKNEKNSNLHKTVECTGHVSLKITIKST